MAPAASRLPGVRIEVAPPPATEALPRMDVAVLVGFAATGPLHLPVVVESVAQFAAVFGPDAPLAWDEAGGSRGHAFLGPAVRAFFSNGGRRCWVIRVARSPASEALRRASGAPAYPVAVTNRFAVPGVLAVAASGRARPALAQGRCEGSWSDGLRVSAALSSPSLEAEVAAPPASLASWRFALRTRARARPGELLAVGDPAGAISYAVVDAVRAATSPGGPFQVEATACASFERLRTASVPAEGWTGMARVSGFARGAAATLSAPEEEGARARVSFHEPMTPRLEAGHWVLWSGGGFRVWLLLEEVERRPAFRGSPPERDPERVRVVGLGPAWRELRPRPPAAAGGSVRASVLTLELRVAGPSGVARLSGVGLTPGHPAAWWSHVADADFYRPPEPALQGDDAQVVPDDAERFPLARVDGAAPVAWIPLGVGPLFGPAPAPLPLRATALERDGLVPFTADLFLDPELAGASLHAIPDFADAIRFLREDTRPLLGMHAGLSVGRGGIFNEATLLGIPDAVHLGWSRRPGGAVLPPRPEEERPPASWGGHRGPCADPGSAPSDGPDYGTFLDCGTRLLAAPVLTGPGATVPPGAYRLHWTRPEPGAEYVLLEATQPDFSDRREVYRGADAEYLALAGREGVFYHQVFLRRGGERSAGSNAVAVRVRGTEWVQRDEASADEALEAEWLAIHRAALRLAAASGDLFAALALPRHFRTAQALRYAERLRAVRRPPGGAEPGALGFTEARALSYGALYFPWLQSDARPPRTRPGAAGGAVFPGRSVERPDRPPAVVPPDGAALGVLAMRATEPGAWVGAANQPLADVVALTPNVAAADWQALQDARINLVRADPRGFLTLSADTLALEPELRPINVRRLLILLRRAALRRGDRYVFEPHGPVLRRAVQRGFEALLTELFRRGAFAGATPAQSFRLVTGGGVGTAADVEAGRLVVELRVAPSVPLTFLTVRVEQSGQRLTVREEL